MKSPEERLVLRSGGWLGGLAGSGVGVLFLFITLSEVRYGNEPETFVAFLIPGLAIVVGAILGRCSFRWIARVLGALRGPTPRLAAGLGLGALTGGLALVFLALLTYLLKEWSGQLNFAGGVPALVTNVLVMFGLFGVIFGSVLGAGFGAFVAFALRTR
jgi:hypothetical protein